MRNNKVIKSMLVTGLLLGFTLTGCGKEQIQIAVKDGYATTFVAVDTGVCVEDALKRAEIYIGEKDVVEPSLDTVISDGNMEILVERCATVTVQDGEEEKEITLVGKCVQDVFDELGITIGEHDYINHSLEASLEDGMNVTIVRRLEVTCSVDGEKDTYLTRATDVEAFLEEQHIALDSKDRIKPSRTSALKEGSKIVIERVSVKEVVENEAIPFETEYENSGDMYTDETKVKTSGVDGKKEVTYQVTYVDGKEESRKAVSEKVIEEPVTQITIKGTKQRRRIVSKQAVEDCDGSGHGYYIITWSDGTVEYQDY